MDILSQLRKVSLEDQLIVEEDVTPLIDAFNRVDQNNIYVLNEGERAISSETWDEYISKIEDEGLKETVLEVRRKTKYFTWSQFADLLNKSFNKFVASIGDKSFLIYLPSEKFSSEHVLVALLWKQIRKLNFQGFISLTDFTLLEDGSNVLFLDDAIYSGNNLIGSMDGLNYETNKKFVYYIVVACSTENISMIKDAMPLLKGNIFYTENIPLIDIPPGDDIHSRLSYRMSPTYFDHKVAGTMSSFPLIYLKGIIAENKEFGMLLPIKPDTEIKDRLYEKYFRDITPGPKELNMERPDI